MQDKDMLIKRLNRWRKILYRYINSNISNKIGYK